MRICNLAKGGVLWGTILVVVLSANLACAADDAAEPAMDLRSVFTQTQLVRDGQAECLLVVPAGNEELAAAAKSVAEAVRQLTGAAVAIKTDASVLSRRFVVAEPFRQTNLVLLGNLNTNQAICFLYANHFTRVDCRWPGPNGFVVQTIGNPWGTQRNVVQLGGSDADGVKQAASFLIELIKRVQAGQNIVLPPICQVVINGRTPPAKHLGGDDPHLTLQAAAGSYIETGAKSALDAATSLLREQIEEGGSMFSAKAHYRGIGSIVALDVLDDYGVLSPEQLHTIDNMYLRDLIEVYREKPWPIPFGQKSVADHPNSGGSDTHNSNGALEYYFPATYLLKYGRPNAAARHILEAAISDLRPFLEQMVRSNHGNYGDEGWTYGLDNLCWFRYAFHDERFELFDQGYARNQWLLGVALRHHAATNGISAFFYNDPKIKYLAPTGSINGWGYSGGTSNWATPDTFQPVRPVELLGVMHVPLDVNHYDGRDLKVGFDKICFMDDFHSDGYYLLFQGGRDHRIRRFRYHNVDMMTADTLVNDGTGIRNRSDVAQQLATGRGEKVAFARTMYPEPAGYADRFTTTVFRRGRYFVIFDRFVATQPGRVIYTQKWTPQTAPVRMDEHWEAYVDQYTLRLTSASPIQEIASAGVVRQMKTIDAQPGQDTSFQNLLYATAPGSIAEFDIAHVDDAAVLVRDTSSSYIALLGYNDQGGLVTHGAIETDAVVFYVGTDGVELFDAGFLRVGGREIELHRSDEALGHAADEMLDDILMAMYDDARDQVQPIASADDDITDSANLLFQRWSFNDFRKRGKVVGARLVKSGDQDWLFDLGRPTRLAEIDAVNIPQTLTAIAASENGFNHDLLTIPVKYSESGRFSTYHYGWFAHYKKPSIADLDVTCRYVRLPADQPQGDHPHTAAPLGIDLAVA